MTGLIRVVVIAILLGLVWSWLKRLMNKRLPNARKDDAAQAQSREAMRPCAHCALHVPDAEAVRDHAGEETRYFCSEAHRQAFLQQEEN